ncbi:hypothetical protein H257_18354 [Aphanomyces astaci]|uniref:Uncharacterized protein n=1 Tax=Aphanomyces astaci TaxID=112090 RepID=W4FDM7_APHAT|nr:hypothetical protein H257_18354 [Aphanomyces astaci]ETV64838.1 hypothetical protein H257_18354 [Aphanomyces astaci]|eukprot:XP_009845695.1 hypothetical protein H257_18354 [Aphanomyces astaci]
MEGKRKFSQYHQNDNAEFTKSGEVHGSLLLRSGPRQGPLRKSNPPLGKCVVSSLLSTFCCVYRTTLHMPSWLRVGRSQKEVGTVDISSDQNVSVTL